MENKVGKFFEKLKPLASMNNTMKIHPVFVEENQRIIERNLIIHSHQTFSNEIEKNYHKNYMDSFYEMLFNNKKNYSSLRQNLQLKKRNHNQFNLEDKNHTEPFLPEINKSNKIIQKEIKGKSYDIGHEIFNINHYKKNLRKNIKIKKNDEVYNKVNLFNNEDKRLLSFIISGEEIRKEYENKYRNKINMTLSKYSSLMKKLKPIKYKKLFNPSFLQYTNFFVKFKL